MATTAAPTKNPKEQWQAEIAAAERETSKFRKRARDVVKRFLDERDVITGTAKWFNIYYANTNILESALYSQLPKPAVSRRFKDFDDDVARVASEILRRSITQDLDDPKDTFDSTMRHCVQDRLIPGLSQAWLRLETDTTPIPYEEFPNPQPDTEAVSEEEYNKNPMLKITDQRVCVDYVFWEDFIWSPCRVWEERRWVGRKVYMDREALVKRFGEEKGNAVPLNYKPIRVGDNSTGSTPQDDTVEKAIVYEIWVRKGRKVVWISLGFPQILDEIDDPLGLVGFEPCPTPMLANITTSNTTPRPDFYMIQDQYNELDSINNRISLLVKACKVVGVYDKGAPGVARMLKEGFDNDLIPVDNWAMFAEKGGIKGQVDWLPLEVVVQALTQLQLAREAIKQQIYELTGIADIVRGASKASETLGAQEIKAKFASVRIKKLQDEVARFAADILRIKAEIQVKHFEPEVLLKASNIEHTADAALAGPAIELLKSEEGFEWRVEVTADSIAQADYDLEKQDRIEFLTAVSSYLEKAGAMFQTVPQSAPLLVGMLKWAVAGFRKAAEIEGMMDKALDDLIKSPPEDKPDPEAEKLKAEQEMEERKMQQELQLAQQKAQQEMEMAQREHELEAQRMMMEAHFEKLRLQMELEAEQRKLDMQEQTLQMKMMFDQAMNAMRVGAQRESAQIDVEHKENSAKIAEQQARAKPAANKE